MNNSGSTVGWGDQWGYEWGSTDPYERIYDHTEIIEAIGYAIKDNPRLSEIESITTSPLDIYSEGLLHLPAVSIFTATNIRSDRSSTEEAGFVYDDNGGEIGQIFETVFNMTAQIDVWTGSQPSITPSQIGAKLEIELLRYDSENNDGFLPNPHKENDFIDNISTFTVSGGSRLDFQSHPDASENDMLRRWMMEIDIGFFYRINTVDLYGPNQYLTKINYPEYGDFQRSPKPDIEIQADPDLESI